MFTPHKAYLGQEKITFKVSEEEIKNGNHRGRGLEKLLDSQERVFIFYTVSPNYCFIIKPNQSGLKGFFFDGIQLLFENNPIKAFKISSVEAKMKIIEDWIEGLQNFLNFGEDIETDDDLVKREFIYKETDPNVLLTHPSQEVRQWFKKQQAIKKAMDIPKTLKEKHNDS